MGGGGGRETGSGERVGVGWKNFFSIKAGLFTLTICFLMVKSPIAGILA